MFETLTFLTLLHVRQVVFLYHFQVADEALNRALIKARCIIIYNLLKLNASSSIIIYLSLILCCFLNSKV